MAELAARDSFDRMIRSQDRLREFIDNTTVAFFRIEMYTLSAAIATTKLVGTTNLLAGSIYNLVEAINSLGVMPNKAPPPTQVLVQTLVQTETKINIEIKSEKEEKGWFDKLLDGVALAGLVGVVNDAADLYDKIKNRGKDAAQKVVCVCQCCCGDKNGKRGGGPPPEKPDNDKDRKNRTNKSNKSNKNRKSGLIQGPGMFGLFPSLGDIFSAFKKVGPEKDPKTITSDNDKKEKLESSMNNRMNQGSPPTSRVPETPSVPSKKLGEHTKPVTPETAKTPKTPSSAAQDLPSNLEQATTNAVEEKTRKYSSGPKQYNPKALPARTEQSNPAAPDKSEQFTSKRNNGFMQGTGDLFDNIGGKGMSLLKTVGKRNAALSIATGVMNVATAENKKAAIVEVAAGAGGATIGSVLGTMLLPGVGTVVGGMVGGWLGEKAGRFIGNKWFNKTEIEAKKDAAANPNNVDVHTLSKAANMTQPSNAAAAAAFTVPQIAPSHVNLNLPMSYKPQTHHANTSLYPDRTAANQDVSPCSTYNINVEGVQVVMPKEEIDEEGLARRIGWEIVSRMKASMNNQVVT